MPKTTNEPIDNGRELGACESVLWTLDSQLAANAVIRSEITGPLTKDHFRSALDRMQRIHPLLRVRVVTATDNRLYFCTDGVPVIPLRWLDGDGLDLQAFMEGEFRSPVRPENGPLARVTIITHGADQFTVVLTMNHAVMDGLSSYYFMQSLCEQLASTSVPGASDEIRIELIPPLEQRLPIRATGWRGLLGYLHLVVRTLMSWVRTGRPIKLPADQVAAAKERQIGFLTWQLDRNITNCLPQLARTHGTTVHGILSAALMEAVHKVYHLSDDATVCCASLTNIRGDLSRMRPNEIGLFVSSLPTFHKPGRQGFWDLAVDVRTQLRNGRQNHHDLLLGPLTNRWLMGLFRVSALGCSGKFAETVENANYGSCAITNLGVLGGNSGWGPVRLTGFNALVSPTVLNPLIVTAMTFKETLTLNVVHVLPLLSRERADRIAAEMVGIIDRLIPASAKEAA